MGRASVGNLCGNLSKRMLESPGFYEQVAGAAHSGSELVFSHLRSQWKEFALDWQSYLAFTQPDFERIYETNTCQAEDKKDLAALDRLLTDDYIFTAPGGAVTDKKKLIEEVKNGVPEEGQTISYEDVKANVYGKAAVVNYRLIVKGRDKDGKDYISRYRNTVVWVKQQGHWRMAAIHVNRIRP